MHPNGPKYVGVLDAKWIQIFAGGFSNFNEFVNVRKHIPFFCFVFFSAALNHMLPDSERVEKPKYCHFLHHAQEDAGAYTMLIKYCHEGLEILLRKINEKRELSNARYVSAFFNEFMSGITKGNTAQNQRHLRKFLTDYIRETSSPNSADTKDSDRLQCVVHQVADIYKAGNMDSIVKMAEELSQLLRRIDYEIKATDAVTHLPRIY